MVSIAVNICYEALEVAGANLSWEGEETHVDHPQELHHGGGTEERQQAETWSTATRCRAEWTLQEEVDEEGNVEVEAYLQDDSELS